MLERRRAGRGARGGTPPHRFHNEDWFERAYCEDLQTTGLLTPDATPRLPRFWHVECAYQDWKWTVDLLWEAARHREQQLDDKLEEVACLKCLRDEHHHRLLDKRAAQARHKALVRHQCLIAKAAALEREMAAAQTIFLWLCRQRHHIRLTRQTLGRLQHEAALACFSLAT